MPEVAIIGAGPAGIATAVQLNIYGIDCVLIEQHEIGGLLRNANLVENYLGFPDGIRGKDLINLFKLQLERLKVEIVHNKVKRISYYGDGFKLESNNEVIYCDQLVLATGSLPKTIMLKGKSVEKGNGKRILSEIHTLFNKEKLNIAIIGAGDAAFDYALNLSARNNVSIHNRSDRVKCLQHLFKSVQKSSNITYYTFSTLANVTSHNENLEIDWSNSNQIVKESVDYLIVAIGREPNLACLNKDVYYRMSELEKDGKLFMVGDVTNGIYRQTGISVGDGIFTAMKLNKIKKE